MENKKWQAETGARCSHKKRVDSFTFGLLQQRNQHNSKQNNIFKTLQNNPQHDNIFHHCKSQVFNSSFLKRKPMNKENGLPFGRGERFQEFD